MKKFLALVISTMMVIGCFAACDNTPSKTTTTIEKNATIVVWDDDKSAGYMPMLIKAFEKEYAEFNVKVVYNIKDSGSTVDDLATAGPSGTGADIIALNHDKLGAAVQQKLLFPNDKYKDETIATQAEDSIKASSTAGMLYGYPIGAESPVMFYNKKLFAGKEDTLKTMDALKTFSKTRHDASASNYGFMFNNGWGNSFWLYGLFAGYGGYAFGKDGTDPKDLGLNNEGAIAAGEYYRSWRALQAPGIDGDGTQVSTMVSMFKQGTVAAFYAEPSTYQSIVATIGSTDSIVRDDVGVTKLPMLPGDREMKPFVTYKMYGVSAYSKNPLAARAFAAFSQKADNQVKRFISNGTIPTSKDARLNDDVVTSEVVKASMLQVPFCTITPSIPEFGSAYWGAMGPALNNIMTTDATIKSIMDICVASMRTAIGNM